MSNQLDALRAILRGSTPKSGRVLSQDGFVATVATRKGVVTLDIPSGIVLVTGDQVRLENGIITSKIRVPGEIPVFDV